LTIAIRHRAEYHHENADDDPHDQRVQIVDLLRDDGLRRLQVVLGISAASAAIAAPH
jgi:hypothetical protein